MAAHVCSPPTVLALYSSSPLYRFSHDALDILSSKPHNDLKMFSDSIALCYGRIAQNNHTFFAHTDFIGHSKIFVNTVINKRSEPFLNNVL